MTLRISPTLARVGLCAVAGLTLWLAPLLWLLAATRKDRR